ncbi:MAG: hypothetical protein H7A51_18395 [Akkermansiaceae bacterium]|nr:hypothetical protein [Akkermansiaceae bacterium]
MLADDLAAIFLEKGVAWVADKLETRPTFCCCDDAAAGDVAIQKNPVKFCE